MFLNLIREYVLFVFFPELLNQTQRFCVIFYACNSFVSLRITINCKAISFILIDLLFTYSFASKSFLSDTSIAGVCIFKYTPKSPIGVILCFGNVLKIEVLLG